MRFLTRLLFILFVFTQAASATVDDRLIRITTAARADAVRAELRTFIWGTTTLPSTLPSETTASSSPVPNIEGLYSAPVKILDVVYGCEISRAYYFQAASPNGTVMLLHGGHDHLVHTPLADGTNPGNDYTQGKQRFIRALLQNGYSVILGFMPHYRPYVEAPPGCAAEVPDEWPNGPAGTPKRDHGWMFSNLGTNGQVLKYFLDPVVQWINYGMSRQNASGGALFTRVVMAGLSGGGWTTTLAAAIDPRIARSYPVAGTLPLYMRKCWSAGDTEQVIDTLYQIAGYLDLYVLGTYPGRKQIQLLLRHDIYFGDDPETMFEGNGKTWEEMLRPYEAAVRNTAHALGSAPSFRIEIDEGAASHAYSRNGAFNVILGDLNEDRREAGAAAETDVFIRSADGQIVHHTPSGWKSTIFYASGTPAVVENAGGAARVDLFFRDEKNVLQHVSRVNGAWSSPATLTLPEGFRALADPVATPTANGIDIVAVAAKFVTGPTTNPCPTTTPFNDPGTARSDYNVYHWTWTSSGGLSAATALTQNGQVISATDNVHRAPVGIPAVVRFQNGLHVFVRAEDARLYHIRHDGSAWIASVVNTMANMPAVAGFPSAVVDGDAIRVYTRSLGYQLYEFSWTGSGSWTEAVPSYSMTGSPAAVVTSSGVRVFVRGLDGKIVAWTRGSSGSWISTSLGGSVISGSPAVTRSGVVVAAHKTAPETVVRHNGTAWSSFAATDAAPLTFTATLSPTDPTATQITLSWTASSSDASNSFVIERSEGGGFARVAQVPGSSYTDTVTTGRAYIYRLRSASSSSFKADMATAKRFDTGVDRGPVKADHLRDVRSATNMARVAAGLTAATFTDPTHAPARATDITTLRTNVIQAFQAAGLPVPAFTTIPSRGAVRRIHFTELVDAVK